MLKSMVVGMGQRVKERRKLLGYTREQFAEKLDLSVTFTADIELGNKGMSIDTLIKICELLSVSADYIIWGKGERPENTILDVTSELDEADVGYAEDIMKTFVKAVSDAKFRNLK